MAAARIRSAYIDVFRGIAILAVLFNHCFFNSIAKISTFVDSNYFGFSPLAFNNGWLGVNLFFILSGMVLYRPDVVNSMKSIMDFYVARCLRLWPLYLLLIACVSIVEHYGIGSFANSVAILLSGLHDLMPNYWEPSYILWVLWSLGIEILFSAVLPFLLLAANRFGFWRLFSGVLVFSFAYRILGDHEWFLRHPDYVNHLINPFKDNIFGRLDDFMVGMAAAKLIEKRKRSGPIYLAALGIAGVLLVCNSWTYLWYCPRTLIVSVIASSNHVAFSLSLCAIIVALKHLPIWQSRVFAPLEFAGLTCYSAYILHAVIIKYVGFNMTDWQLAPLQFILFVAGTFFLSAITFAVIEAPAIKHLPQWAGRISSMKTDLVSYVNRFR